MKPSHRPETDTDTAEDAAREWATIERATPTARRELVDAVARVQSHLQTILNLAYPIRQNVSWRVPLTVDQMEDALLAQHSGAEDALKEVRRLLRAAVTP